MRTRTKIIVAALLFLLPIVGRWLWFNRGVYTPPTITELDDTRIDVPLPVYNPLAEEAVEGAGRVVFDLAHDNNLEADDLTPLRERLKARGATLRTYDGYTAFLDYELQGAVALVVAAPTLHHTDAEVAAILDFVEDGGRVLLVADPTRQIPVPEDAALADLLLPPSAVPAMNSLANPLGVVYFDDYLYNVVENEANYRNVKLSVGEAEHPLTEGLDTVILFAAHSLEGDGQELLVGDENTHSDLRSGESLLAGAVLSFEDQVLALGDLTVLSAPYHTTADNDRFLSNIADWLISAERVWHLRDFPYLFQRPVDLVQVSGEFVDPRLVAKSSELDQVLALADQTLTLRDVADDEHDALFVGTFDDVELVQDYLEDAGVVITIVKPAEGTPTPTPAAEEEEEERSNIEVEGLGTVLVEGTSLFLVDQTPARVVVIALAEDGDAAMASLDRLALADFAGCVDNDQITLCSAGEAGEGIGLDEQREPQEGEPTPPAELEESQPRIGSILESQVALAAGTPSLQELAEEEYEENSQAGETYTYTIFLDESQDLIWAYGWCATTKEILKDNWENITVDSSVNGYEVPLSKFAATEYGGEGLECRLYYALVTDWPEGTHTLLNEVTFDMELYDGTDTFPAGTHYYEYVVTVAP